MACCCLHIATYTEYILPLISLSLSLYLSICVCVGIFRANYFSQHQKMLFSSGTAGKYDWLSPTHKPTQKQYGDKAHTSHHMHITFLFVFCFFYTHMTNKTRQTYHTKHRMYITHHITLHITHTQGAHATQDSLYHPQLTSTY